MAKKALKRGKKSGRGPRRPGAGGKQRRDTIFDIVDQAVSGRRRQNQSTDSNQ